MTGDKKKEIMYVSANLFNKKGYLSVTMRDIASELKMSVGNLTYHFKKKEDLILAILENSINLQNEITIPSSISKLDEFLNLKISSVKGVLNNTSYYLELKSINKKLYKLQLSLLTANNENLLLCFKKLEAESLLKKEKIKGHRQSLVDAINLILTNWSVSDEILLHERLSSCLWAIIYPNLTSKGKEIYLNEVYIHVVTKKDKIKL